jgi:hypothetical protein
VDHQPFWMRMPGHGQIEKATRDLVLCAAAIGAKRGALPLNLAGIRATISERKSDCATVVFERQDETITGRRPGWVRVSEVTIGNLDAWPSEAIEEPGCDLAAAA